MKKTLAIIALAAVCFGTTASAYTPVRAQQDTLTKTKVKKKDNKVKIKKKKVLRDTTTHR